MMAVVARGRATAVLAGLALLAFALVVGRAVVETQAVDAATGPVLLGTLAVMAAVSVMVAGPIPTLAGLVLLTTIPPPNPVSVGGGVSLTAADAFFAGLVVWSIVNAAGLTRRDQAVPLRSAVRGWPVLVFLGFAGLTLLYVAAVDPSAFYRSAVSWIRIVQTASIGFLAVAFIRTPRDLAFILGAAAIGAAISATLALVGAFGTVGSGPLGERGGGIVSANTLGLTSALLVLLAVFPAVTTKWAFRLPALAIGCAGLVQAASVASIIGAVVAVALGLALTPTKGRSLTGMRSAKAITTLVIAFAVAYGLASVIRP